MAELDEGQMQIKLVTRQQIYAVPDVPYSVPSKVDCNSLNKLLNQILQDSNNGIIKNVDFDFLVQGELLRVPLYEHLQEHNISAEATLEIEYIERTPAPEPQNSILHDDWVASVRTADKLILTGRYDNTVTIHTTDGQPVAFCNEHTDRIRAVSWIDPTDPSKGFLTASHDLTAILWNFEIATKQCKPHAIFRGHEQGIDSLGVSPSHERFATGGWDTHLKLWSLEVNYEAEEPVSKRIKGVTTKVPLHTFSGHKETISAVGWINPGTVFTASMDHTIKFWDAELCGIKNEIVGQKAFLGASWSPLANAIIAGSADRHVRLYDPRSTEGTLCKTTFASHTLWVTAVAWSTHDEHLFISGSYDGWVKIWDTRSPKASLYDLSGQEDKVLCVDWSSPKYIVSGGTDNNVHVFKNKQFQ